MERRLNVKMKRSKKRCPLGVAIPDRLFLQRAYANIKNVKKAKNVHLLKLTKNERNVILVI